MNEVYTFSEPNPGTVSQTEQICIEIKTGRIASPLTIVPRWTAGTTTGDWSNTMMSSLHHLYIHGPYYLNLQKALIILHQSAATTWMKIHQWTVLI